MRAHPFAGWLTACLVAATLAACAGGSRTADPSTPPSHQARENVCKLFEERGVWFDAVHATERRWGAPAHVQMAIMYQESRFRRDARPPRPTLFGIPVGAPASSAYGYSQAIDGTWDWYREATGRDDADRTRFADAVDFMGWYMAYSRNRLGLTPEDAYRHYLAYHEGHAGFARGSYNRKQWLIGVAQKVADRARLYRSQLSGCRRSLEAGLDSGGVFSARAAVETIVASAGDPASRQ